jgi:hypothetical protein
MDIIIQCKWLIVYVATFFIMFLKLSNKLVLYKISCIYFKIVNMIYDYNSIKLIPTTACHGWNLCIFFFQFNYFVPLIMHLQIQHPLLFSSGKKKSYSEEPPFTYIIIHYFFINLTASFGFYNKKISDPVKSFCYNFCPVSASIQTSAYLFYLEYA